MSAAPLHVLVNGINDNARPRGPDRYLMELLPRLLAADPGLEVTLAHAPWQRGLSETAFGPRVRLECLDPPRAPSRRLLWQATGFVDYANRLGADLTFLPNLIWAPRLRGPSVLVAHDMLHFRAPEKFGHLKAAALRRVIRRAVARSDRVIAVSAFTAADVVRFGGADPGRVVTITEGGPGRERRAGAMPDRTFLFVGKLERTKGIVDLIHAFRDSALLARQNYRLLIVGPEGNATRDVEAALRGADARIELRGFVSEEELRDAFLRCRGFVFPSVAEGFGLVVLEAMARGAPVIAARATSLPEVVGEAGLLVPPGDRVALREALEALAGDDALFARLQRAGYDRLARYSWDSAGARTAALFRETVG
ncbi:glycosyltransferase family 4 protein [Acidimangrovimonas pyrenivorans]|uniref:Glycosyltransferase family 4 protein n=1 Tax=Acidimangrovimonas pyrenivorans TaxID=2030798 RepID=A0ABV7AGQ3_9RHOB